MPIAGRQRCRAHGGKTPRGLASPHTATGEHSRDLPTWLAARIEAATGDPELLSLRQDVATELAFIDRLCSRLNYAASADLIKELVATWAAAEVAKRDPAALAAALNAHGRVMDRIGTLDEEIALMREIGQHMQARRLHVESERKRMLEAQQYIAVEQVMLLVGALTEAVRANVTDRRALEAINTRFARLMEVPGDRGAAS
jgi:hypothetical protein